MASLYLQRSPLYKLDSILRYISAELDRFCILSGYTFIQSFLQSSPWIWVCEPLKSADYFYLDQSTNRLKIGVFNESTASADQCTLTMREKNFLLKFYYPIPNLSLKFKSSGLFVKQYLYLYRLRTSLGVDTFAPIRLTSEVLDSNQKTKQ